MPDNEQDLTNPTEPVAPEVQAAPGEPSSEPVPAQEPGGEPPAADPAVADSEAALALAEQDIPPTMPAWLPVGVSIADGDRTIQVENGEKNIYRGDALFLFQDGSLVAVPMTAFRELIGR